MLPQLKQEGINHYQASQLELVCQTWQRALKRYREQGNRQAEGNILNDLDTAPRTLGQYSIAKRFNSILVSVP